MTEAEFASIATTVCVTVLIAYMFWIIYQMGKESKAGRFGMIILFVALGTGMIGFVAKNLIQLFLD